MSSEWINGIIILLGIIFAVVYPVYQYITVRHEENLQGKLKKLIWIMPIGWVFIIIWLIEMI